MARKTHLGDLPPQPDPRAPLDAATFLRVARPVLTALTADLLTRADADAGIRKALERHHQAELAASRTADDYPVWRRRVVVQIAAAWLLSCVFVRVLEDRGLISARIAGPGARDSEAEFFRIAPSLGEREYLHIVFRELTRLPAAAALFDLAHNLVWRLGPSADGCKQLLQLFRAPNADAPAFRFGQPDTRFLGDLYQDLDDGVREQFALLQTPDFVERFILDRTLEPAIREYGVDHTDIIDPTCGSGHFLLGAFTRICEHLRHAHPGLHDRELARDTLAHIYGVDINPYAVSIARFRLTLQFLETGNYIQLLGAPAPVLHVIVADSLFYGFAGGQGDLGERPDQDSEPWHGAGFSLEDPEEARKILVERTYAAVVGNPPYIAVKDPVLREVYRKKYTSAAGLYALSAPFLERFFQLAKRGGGYVGQITSNSFMKREFGAALIEKVLPKFDLESVINAAGAFIPGHGTPTVLIFGRNRPPSADDVLAVLAKRGEPQVPPVPAQGLVWSSIDSHWNEEGFENDFISVETLKRATLHIHPWSLEGGGAQELKEHIERFAPDHLSSISDSIGTSCITGEDNLYILSESTAKRLNVGSTRILVTGESLRDWGDSSTLKVLYPYEEETRTLRIESKAPLEVRFMWPYRSLLSQRKLFSGPMIDQGLTWYELRQFYADKLLTPLTIAFAEIATHNHFVLFRDERLFKQTAPIIKLPTSASEGDHLALLGYLNSSAACFYIKQGTYPKGASSNDKSTEKGKAENNRYQFSGTAVGRLPVPPPDTLVALTTFSRKIEQLRLCRDLRSPHSLVNAAFDGGDLLAAAATRAELEDAALLARMVAIQEDLDWAVYALFDLAPPETAGCWTPDLGLTPDQRPFKSPTPPAHLGPADRDLWLARAAAIAASKQLRLIENSINKRRWWGARGVFGHKVATFAERVADAAAEQIADLTEQVLRARCEHTIPTVVTARELERELANNPHYQALRDYLVAQDPRADPLREQLARESVPFLAGHRYSSSGRDRHARWREVWDLQRLADVSEAKLPHLREAFEKATAAAREATARVHAERSKLGVAFHLASDPPAPRRRGAQKLAVAPVEPPPPLPDDPAKPPALLEAEAQERAAYSAQNEARLDLEWAETHHRKVRKLIPVPSKYEPADFRDPAYFRLRGKLDVPRERFISYPGAASDSDPAPVYGWAGWTHLQRALALLQLYYHRKLEESWPPDRLVPLLAGLEELLPWVKQWHADERHADTGESYADALETHIELGCSELGVTRAQLVAWTPPDARQARAARPSITNRSRTPARTDEPAPTTPEQTTADPAAPTLRNKRRRPPPPVDEATTTPSESSDITTAKKRGRPRKAGTR